MIPTQDLTAHHAPLMAELEAAALRVIASGRFILGAENEAFERETAAVCGVREAVALSSGTDALLAALMALDVGPGDDVLTTPYSFFATAGAIARLGARPVFADVEPDTLNLDPVSAAAALTPSTKAVIVVHLFGRVARTERLASLCATRGISIIEDAAQAIGARAGATGAAVGQLGRAATLSFFPSKNLGGFGDGGMLVTDDGDFAKRVRLLRAHGSEKKYFHELVGGNFRLDELQAALLRVKLPHLASWTAARRALVARYRARLSGVSALALPPDDAGCVWNQLVVRVSQGRRDALAAHLAARGIATAVYYPRPLHLQACFASLGHGPGDFPVAEAACADSLALPLYPELADAAVDRVCGAIEAYFETAR